MYIIYYVGGCKNNVGASNLHYYFDQKIFINIIIFFPLSEWYLVYYVSILKIIRLISVGKYDQMREVTR